MGLSLLSALQIQNNKVRCEPAGPSKNNNKWAGWIMLDVEKWRPIVNTEYIYNCKEEAIKAMEDMVKTIREADLTPQKEKLSNIMGEDGPVVGKIIDMAKNGIEGEL